MPLHLLHHKSYHVYNTANVERVRRDEAAAKAIEEAEEQRMQEVDAERRIQLLRERAAGGGGGGGDGGDGGRGIEGSTSRRKKIADEREQRDEAEFQKELGLAVENHPPSSSLLSKTPARDDGDRALAKRPRRTDVEFSLTTASGHINLFPTLETPNPRATRVEKNAEYEAEKKAKEDSFAAQYTMGLGKPADELKPWYSTVDKIGEKEIRKAAKTTEWDRKKEERRKERGDPLVDMMRGARGVRTVEEGRREWKKTREREVGSFLDGIAGDLDLNSHRSRSDDRRRKRGRDEGHSHREGKRARGRSRSPDHRKMRGESLDRDHRRYRKRSRDKEKEHGSRRREDHSESRSDRHSKRARSRSPRKHKRSKNINETPDQDAAMLRLRAERDKREQAERRKADALIGEEKRDRVPAWEAVTGGRYSKQFGEGDIRK